MRLPAGIEKELKKVCFLFWISIKKINFLAVKVVPLDTHRSKGKCLDNGSKILPLPVTSFVR